MSKLEELDYDLNNIFTLTYNFESLKLMLSSISKNQQTLNQRLTALETQPNPQSTILYKKTDPNKQTNANTNTIDPKHQQSIITPYDNHPSSSENKPKHEAIPSLASNIDEEDNIPQTDYNLRIKVLETKINKLYSLLSSSTTHKDLSNLEEDLQNKMNVLYDKNNETTNKLLTLESSLDEIKVKVSDFNIYELLKGNTNVEDGSIDSSKVLIQALENKVFKKFALEDEKIKLNDKEIIQAKTDIADIKNTNEGFNRAIPMIRNDITEAIGQIDSLSNSTDNKLIELHKTLSNMNNAFNQKINAINEELKAINEANDLDLKETDLNKELVTLPNMSGFVTEKEYIKYKESLLKKLNEIDRKIALLIEKCDLDPIHAQIKNIEVDLSDKATHQELYNANDRVLTLGDNINSLRDDQAQVIDDIKKFKAEQNQLFKKLEAVQSQLLVLKIEDSSAQKSKENSLQELSKFVDIGSFNDFMKMYHKDIEKMKRDNEDIRRNNEEINESLKVKATEMQLNQLEDYLISITEEIKNTFNRKYADRLDTNKNFKSIETQIKHIIEVYIKRSDKSGDNWLIAKKPIGGYSCASCENYIGELNEKNEYLAWNKVPGKESYEKTYRVGNGFSHILNMLNVDKLNKKEQTENNMFESDNENSNPPHTMESRKKKNLPPLESNSKSNRNQNQKGLFTEGNVFYSDSGEDRKGATNYEQKGNEDEPKIVKIYKLKKNEKK